MKKNISQRCIIVFLFMVKCSFVFSQNSEAEYLKTFTQDWIDTASEMIGKNTSKLNNPDEWKRVESKNDNRYSYMLTFTHISDGSTFETIADSILGPIFGGDTNMTRIETCLYISGDSLIDKVELQAEFKGIHGPDAESAVRNAVVEKMDKLGKQLEVPRIEKHWFGPDKIDGRWMWLWNSKIVSVIPAKNFLAWQDNTMYVTMIKQ